MAGLSLRTGLHGCPQCGLLGNRQYVKKHLVKCGNGLWGEDGIPSDLAVQQVNTGATRTNILVTPKAPNGAALPAVPDLLVQAQMFDWQSTTLQCWGIQYATLMEIHRLITDNFTEFPTHSEAYDVVREFIIENQLATFNLLCSLQHYTTTLAYQTMSLPHVWWTDHENWSEILYKGNWITLDQLGQIFDLLESRIIELLETKVLLNLRIHAPYGTIADTLTKTKPGYSFIDDPRNPFIAFKSKLLEGILADPKLRAKFVTQDGNGVEQLNIECCWSWMASVAKLDGLSMVDTKFKSGSPVHMIMRPFAVFIAETLFPGKVADYATMLFMDGKQYTSDTLSALMGHWTEHVLGWPVGLNPWHQINIAWQFKLCAAATELLGEDAISAINTFQAGHSRDVEDHVYRLSPESMFGVSKQVLHSCLMVSKDWQKTTRLMPGGLALPYKNATRGHFDALIVAGTIVLPKSRTSFNDELLQRFDTYHKTVMQAYLTTHTGLCETIEGVQALKEEHQTELTVAPATLREIVKVVQVLTEEICALQEEVQWGGGGGEVVLLPTGRFSTALSVAHLKRKHSTELAPTQVETPKCKRVWVHESVHMHELPPIL
ncbi:hypothetical protein DFH09DRAFT_1078745 [Mycena vulgaris]|nr:hypothetical protein DFH09DRAFT_1078745 [Mycena vulgaris]